MRSLMNDEAGHHAACIAHELDTHVRALHKERRLRFGEQRNRAAVIIDPEASSFLEQEDGCGGELLRDRGNRRGRVRADAVPFLNTTESPRATRTVPLNPALDTYDWTSCSIRAVLCANPAVAGARISIEASSIRRISIPDRQTRESGLTHIYIIRYRY